MNDSIAFDSLPEGLQQAWSSLLEVRDSLRDIEGTEQHPRLKADVDAQLSKLTKITFPDHREMLSGMMRETMASIYESSETPATRATLEAARATQQAVEALLRIEKNKVSVVDVVRDDQGRMTSAVVRPIGQ